MGSRWSIRSNLLSRLPLRLASVILCSFLLSSVRKEEQQKRYQLPHTKPLIIVDPGHGGADEGAKVGKVKEKDLTLATAWLLRRELNHLGYRVIMTRGKDLFISLARRVSIANKTYPLVFVSLHYNSSPSSQAEGIEIFYHRGWNIGKALSSRRLAQQILSELIRNTSACSRGVKNGGFYVIRETNMPAVLVEGGFMTHKEELLRLEKQEYLQLIAKSIADGIDKYLNVPGAS